MGYDMYQVEQHPDYEAAKKAHNDRRAALDARIRELKKAKADGSQLSEFEETVLTEGEQQELIAERRKKWVEENVKNYSSFSERRAAMFRALERPATEEYISTLDELDKVVEEPIPHSDYFRLNIFGMSRYADRMRALGMLKELRAYEDWPPRPKKLKDEVQDVLDEAVSASPVSDKLDIRDTLQGGLDSEYWIKTFGPGSENPVPFTKKDIDLFVAYSEQVQEHLSKHDASVPGIEEIKFSSNDGWWVTKEECASALAVWDGLSQEERDQTVVDMGDYWNAWIDYLRDGAAANGFTVH